MRENETLDTILFYAYQQLSSRIKIVHLFAYQSRWMVTEEMEKDVAWLALSLTYRTHVFIFWSIRCAHVEICLGSVSEKYMSPYYGWEYEVVKGIHQDVTFS